MGNNKCKNAEQKLTCLHFIYFLIILKFVLTNFLILLFKNYY